MHFNIVGSKFTVFALGLYLEGRFKGGFLHYWIGDLVFGGAYFRNFTVYVVYIKSFNAAWTTICHFYNFFGTTTHLRVMIFFKHSIPFQHLKFRG